MQRRTRTSAAAGRSASKHCMRCSANDVPTARRLLHATLSDRNSNSGRIRCCAQRKIASAFQRRCGLSLALRVKRHIDASTEIFAGASLRQADFVLNRISRLQRQREPVPLRVLWMPETSFLRRHALFHDIVDSAGLPAYWQEYGVPDVCEVDPKDLRLQGAAARARDAKPRTLTA